MLTSLRGLNRLSSDSQDKGSNNSLAILAMMAAMAFFTINDTLVKIASESLPTGQIIAIRGVITLVLLGAVVIRTKAVYQLHFLVQPVNLLRALLECFSTILFLTALFNMSIGETTSILQAVPLVVTAGSAFLLREYVGWRRWLAILIGFTGVLIIIRPGMDGFNLYALVALAAVFAASGRDLAARRLPHGIPTILVSYTTLLAVTLVGFLYSFGETWVALSSYNLLILASAAVFLVMAQFLIVIATRFGEVSAVSPFRYTSVLLAILIGYFIWNDVPDIPMIIGVMIVIITGIYSFHREKARARLLAQEAAASSD